MLPRSMLHLAAISHHACTSQCVRDALDYPAGSFHFEANHALPVDIPIMRAFIWHHSVARGEITVV
jgi:hypothetical protein